MSYPLNPTEFRSFPHNTSTAADRLRYVLGGFTAERTDVITSVPAFNTTGPGFAGFFARRMQKSPLLNAQPTISTLYLPHVLTLQAASEAVDPSTLAVSAPTYTKPFQPLQVMGMVEQQAKEQVFRDWGVELSQPAMITVALADAYRFNVGDRVLFLNTVGVVSSPLKLYALGMVNDHAEFIVEQPNFAVQ